MPFSIITKVKSSIELKLTAIWRIFQNYAGTNDNPTLFGGCASFIRLGPSNNNGTMDIISLKAFDYESGDINSDKCTFILSKPAISVKELNFNVKDLNDNRPFFDNYPNASLDFPEVKWILNY